jgi:hypothetical protein
MRASSRSQRDRHHATPSRSPHGTQADLGQIEDLPDHHPDYRCQHQVGAAPPALGHVDDHLVRVINPGQVCAQSAGLLAGLATAGAPLPRRDGRLA